MARVLVTGGTGLIGRQALAQLVERGWEVHALSARRPPGDGGDGVTWHQVDLGDGEAVVAALRRLAPSHLLHFAWSVTPGQVWTSIDNLPWVEMSLRLVRAFAAAGGERAVLAGSCGEYAWSERPCSEHSTPVVPRTLYGICKDALHRVVAAAAPSLDLELAWGRIFFVYGPAEHPERLVAFVARALLEGREAPTTHGDQLRDYLHSQDVAGAFVALLEGRAVGPVNIGSGEGVSLRRIVTSIGELVGRPELLRIGEKPAATFEPPRIVADVARLRDEVGWRPRYDLESGLGETVEWWRDRLGAGRA